MLSRLDYLYELKREKHRNASEIIKDYIKDNRKIIDCKYGCNPYGCSPLALKTFQEEAKNYDFTHYPEPTGHKLKEGLASYWRSQGVDINLEHIVVGEGSIGILEGLNKMLLFPGARVLGYQPQWKEYISECKASGATYNAVRLLREDRYSFKVNTFLEQGFIPK